MQIISFALQIYLYVQFDRSSTFRDLAPTICIISCICSILVVIINSQLLKYISGKYSKYQQNPRAIVNSFLIIILQCSAVVSYFFLSLILIYTNNSYSNYGFIFVILLMQSTTNCIVIGITICYFVFEKKQIRFEVYFLMLCFAGFIAIMIEFFLIFFACTAFLFGTLLMIVLKQLIDGRFQLKKNQSFGLCNAIYLGIMVPCNIF